MSYDEENIFAKILRGEIPCDKVYENDYILAFKDINPLADVHVLVIPKGAYVSWDDFSARADSAEIVAFVGAVGELGRTLKSASGLSLADGGYRVISNHGKHGNQEVPHFHVHIIGGEPLGAMLAKKRG